MRLRTVREGSVGILLLVFFAAIGGLILWLRDVTLTKETYKITVEFADANRLKKGAVVRYRGVPVGKIKAIEARPNGVDAILEIESVDLRIPKDATVDVNQAGLVGETSIDIQPQSLLSSSDLALSPLDSQCNSNVIICDNDRLQGDTGASFQELVNSSVELADQLANPQLLENINQATANAGLAAEKIAELSQELTLLSGSIRQEVQGISIATEAITKTADVTSAQIAQTGEQISTTVARLDEFATNINNLVLENRGSLVATLDSISATSDELRLLAGNLTSLSGNIDSTISAADTTQLIQNLEVVTANAASASDDLRNLSESLNSPTNVIALQQILDSARSTFENAQKITADLDELTGNPTFRSNLLELVNGLSDLVSSADQLEELVYTAQALEPLQIALEEPTYGFSQDLEVQLNQLVVTPRTDNQTQPYPPIANKTKAK